MITLTEAAAKALRRFIRFSEEPVLCTAPHFMALSASR